MQSQRYLEDTTRRHFFGQCGLGVGSMALATLLAQQSSQASSAKPNPFAPREGHFPARAKNVIFLFQAGGPSHLELFDYKPKLQELSGQVIPASYVENKRFAFIKKDAKLLGTRRTFGPQGECRMELSELIPHMGSIADDICLIRSMKTDVFNHGPAKLFVNTGTNRFGRPSMGAWVTYGLGSESQDLPGFVVLQSGPRGPGAGRRSGAAAFFPRLTKACRF